MSELHCAICNDTAASVDAAIAAGWLPAVDDPDGEEEFEGPFCPACLAEHFDVAARRTILKKRESAID